MHLTSKIKFSSVSPNLNLFTGAVVLQRMEEDGIICIEDRLKALGIVTEKVDLRTKDHASSSTNTVLDIYSRGKISVDVNMPPKKVCVSNMVSHKI